MNPSHDIYTLLQHSILGDERLIEAYLQAPPKGSLADRLAIYIDGYYGRFEEVLHNDYQTLALLMGEHKFSNMCHLYVMTYPSSHYSLNFLGQHLSQFLRETLPYKNKPYLAEIAAYEWAESQAFMAADAMLLTTKDLQSLPENQWPDMQFYLHPSCQVLSMQWNSLSLIKSLRQSDKQRPKPKKLTKGEAVIIWRHQQQIKFSSLDAQEYMMLQAIKDKAPFVKICKQFSKVMEEERAANYIVRKLSSWINDGLFINQMI